MTSLESNDFLLNQVVDITENGAIVLKWSALEETFLNEQYRDKLPVVVSIAGELQSGKSFALDALARCFLDHNDGQPSEISLPPLYTEETHQKRGIFLTKRPVAELTLELLPGDENQSADSREVVVFLMDSSSLLDGFDRSANVKMFALSLLFSSIQIFNVMSKLNSATIEYLQYLIEFTRFNVSEIVSQENEDALNGTMASPFQQLVLFIRDWPLSHRYPFGKIGGHDMLADWLLRMPDFEQCLGDNFSTATECFLLPNPGDYEYQQSSFRQQLKEFVEQTIYERKEHVIKTLLNIGSRHLNNPQMISCQQLCQFILNLAEHFQLILEGDNDHVSSELALPRLSHLSLYEMVSELDLHQLRANFTQHYREIVRTFLETSRFNNDNNDDGETAMMMLEQLNVRHIAAKEIILGVLRKSTKFARNQDRIERECIELSEELDQINLLLGGVSSLVNAKMSEIITALKADIQNMQNRPAISTTSAEPPASAPVSVPAILKVDRVSLRKCFWLYDEFVYNDGTRCHKYGIWSTDKGPRYKEAWADFTKLTFASLKSQLGEQRWNALPRRIQKKDANLPVCSSPSRRILAADKVIM